MFDTILVCTDGSEHAMRAARYAADLAQKYGASVIAINVSQASLPIIDPSALIDGVVGESYREEVVVAQERIRDGLCELFKSFDVPFRFRGEDGTPVSTIVAVAEQERVNLIVLGSRGLGGFRSFFVGSVSDGVLHHAHCPVLVVR